MVLFPFLSYFFGSEISKDNGPSMSVFNTLHSLFPVVSGLYFYLYFLGLGGGGGLSWGNCPLNFK